MSTHDARWVKELIDRTQEAARKLRDNKLNEHLDAAKKHISEKLESTPAKKA